jgi:hypothetical protein
VVPTVCLITPKRNTPRGGVVAHASNPSTQEWIKSSRPALVKLWGPYLKNKMPKNGLGVWLSDRAPDRHVQASGFSTPVPQVRKEKTGSHHLLQPPVCICPWGFTCCGNFMQMGSHNVYFWCLASFSWQNECLPGPSTRSALTSDSPLCRKLHSVPLSVGHWVVSILGLL